MLRALHGGRTTGKGCAGGAPAPGDTDSGGSHADDSGDPGDSAGQGQGDTGEEPSSDSGDDSGDSGGGDLACDASFFCINLADVVNTDHSNGPWTDNPSESFDVSPGVQVWNVADGSTVPFEIVDPDSNEQRSMIATKGGEDSRPSYAFPESFIIDGGGASGSRLHIAGLASGWSDPTIFAGVAATLTLEFADDTEQVIDLENGFNMDDWNHTWHSASSTDAVRVYEDTTYGRHIDAFTVALASSSTIVELVLLDDASVHTGTAEKTSVAIFALTVEP